MCVCPPSCIRDAPPAAGDAPPQMRTCALPHMTTTPQKNTGHANTLTRRLLHHAIITSIPHLRRPHQPLSNFAHNSATASLHKPTCSASQACRAVPLVFPHLLYPSHLLRPAAGCLDQSSHQRRTLVFSSKNHVVDSGAKAARLQYPYGWASPTLVDVKENGPFWLMNQYYRCKVLVSAF